MYASVAQLDRAPDFGSGGSGFDSLEAHQFINQHIKLYNFYSPIFTKVPFFLAP